jgi:cytochrome c2
MRDNRVLLALAVFGAGALGATYVAGFVTSEHHIFPYRHVAKLDRAAVALVRRGAEPEPPAPIQSTHFRLRQEPLFTLELDREGTGGAMTSIGDELILLTHDGQLFEVSGGEARGVAIAPPSNGSEAYIAAAETRLSHLHHRPDWFRYNDILYFETELERGLLASFTEWHDEHDCYGTTISRLPLPVGVDSILDVRATVEDWVSVYRTQPCLPPKDVKRAVEAHMAGGRMAFEPPRTVFLANGDYHWDGLYAPDALPQRADNDYGKVLAIDLEDGSAVHVSIGHRNMQGILLDDDGALWVAEHGPRGGDELNLIVPGANYGWPKVTYGTRYNALPWPDAAPHGAHAGFVEPIYSWVPSIGISNLTKIENFHPAWDGDLLVASLAEGTLFRLHVREQRVVIAEPARIGKRIRYAHQHSDGRIYLWTDDHELIALSVEENSATDEFLDDMIRNLAEDPERQEQLSAVIADCRECHSFEAGIHERGPSLGDVFERRIAATHFPAYSPALQSRGGTWTAEALAEYLRAPQAFARGTTMPDAGLTDDALADVVEVMRRLKDPE